MVDVSVRAEHMTHPASSGPEQLLHRSTRRIWRLQYGPCWCRGLPGESGSFDFVRTSSRETPLGTLDRNVLILPDRVIDGSQPVFLQLHDRVPNPRLVVTTAACPAAALFWKELPVGWSPVNDLVSVDVHVAECVSGYPEALMAAVLNYAASHENSGYPGNAVSFGTSGQTERDALAH